VGDAWVGWIGIESSSRECVVDLKIECESMVEVQVF
jgi:hypothetical protein